MRLSARALNRATLARQLLLGREATPVEAAARRVVALQAQSPPSPYLALWNRVAELDLADVDEAFTHGRLVRSNVPRMTLHAVAADEHQAFREAMEPTLRAARLRDRRFLASGLTADDADRLTPELVAFAARPRRAAECEAWLAERLGGAPHPGAWWGLRQYAPWRRHPTGGPWAFEQETSYVAPPAPPRLDDDAVAAEMLAVLVWRYLEGYGPSSVADMALFCLVPRHRAKAAVAALGDRVETLSGPNGEVLYDVPGAPRPPEDTPAPARLLGMWDNVLLAHVDRSRVVAEAHRKVVFRSNGDVLPTLFVDGCVAGVWRATEGRVEARAFGPIGRPAWAELEGEAAALLAALAGRDPAPYARYHHWWAKLPAGEDRVLARSA